jgi:hypothetical protein
LMLVDILFPLLLKRLKLLVLCSREWLFSFLDPKWKSFKNFYISFIIIQWAIDGTLIFSIANPFSEVYLYYQKTWGYNVVCQSHGWWQETIEWLICGLPLGVWTMHEPFLTQLFTTKLNTMDYFTYKEDAKMASFPYLLRIRGTFYLPRFWHHIKMGTLPF